MQEDQPTFKVTDRRLFNADGSPRDLPPEEKPEPKAVVAEEPAAAIAAAEEQAKPESEEGAAGSPDAEEEFTEEDLAGAQDPASFVSFVMSIASNAASSLGMMEHQREVDVELGKHWIDVLGMLEKKTAGNLTPQEKRMLEGLLADLRMQYVSVVNSPQQARRFTGSDITGGR